jgi:tetratricopeptide (TPR) repeat protein
MRRDPGTARWIACLALAAGLIGAPALAQQRAIADLRVTKVGDVAAAQIVFACRVGYLSHTPLEASADVSIRLTLHPSCLESLGRGARDELFRPPSADLAEISEIEFLTDDAREATVIVRFNGLANVDVRQDTQRNTVTIEIATDELVAVTEPTRTADDLIFARPDAPGPATPRPEPAPSSRTADAPTPAAREPLRLILPEPLGSNERYVVQVSAGKIIESGDLDGAVDDGRILYVTERAVGERRWSELRIGFFDTEREARELLDRVLATHPDAVIAIAGEREQAAAAGLRFEPESDSTTVGAPIVDGTEGDLMMSEARMAMLTGEYTQAAGIYSQLARSRDYARHLEAREFLGLAHERLGQLAEARAAYRAYLGESPEGPDADRVRQRLAGLIAEVDVDAVAAVEASGEPSGRLWDFAGGLSQYVRNDRYQLIAGRPEVISQSAVLSHVDFSLRRNGSRFDFQSRINALHVYDLLDEPRNGDQALVSNAYVGIVDNERGWSARVGRQSMYKGGVLGRFDGAHVDYRWKPKVVLNMVAGFPVESPHYALSDRREFVGLSVDLDQIIGQWDLSVFSITQQVDGISDREAIGGEAHYRSERWNIVTALDMDLSYGVLNSALVATNWRATDKLTFNARADVRAAPFLTTYNSTIGQPVLTVEELSSIYTESQIRRLARDRTSQARTGSLGMSWPLFDRFQMNADVTYTEYDETVASGGVTSRPASDPQLYFLLNFIGSSVFKDGDTAIFELRHNQTATAETLGFVFDFRLPFGTRLRINPRLVLSTRDYTADRSSQVFAEYMLRFLLRMRGRHRFEAEVGGLWSDRTFPVALDGSSVPIEQSSARFINLGYWWEF